MQVLLSEPLIWCVTFLLSPYMATVLFRISTAFAEVAG
jgi:hypothetical protein